MNRRYVLYHGTGLENAKRIMREGLKPYIYLSPDIAVAREFANTKQMYPASVKSVPRRPAVFEVTLYDSDFRDMINYGVPPRVVRERFRVLQDVLKHKFWEYLWYFNIPPDRLRRIE